MPSKNRIYHYINSVAQFLKKMTLGVCRKIVYQSIFCFWYLGIRLLRLIPKVNFTGLGLVFVCGCGRSGTTILGDVIGSHQNVDLIFEPYAFWAAVSPKFDALGMFVSDPSRRYQVDLSSLDVCRSDLINGYAFRLWVARLILRKRLVVEKMPWNVFKAEALSKIFPDAKFIFIVRPGNEVVSSIDKLSRRSSYQFGIRSRDQWWGLRLRKAIVIADLAQKHFSELKQLEFNRSTLTQIAWCEWILSNQTIFEQNKQIGNRSLVIHYEYLQKDPKRVCAQIGALLFDSESENFNLELIKKNSNFELELNLTPDYWDNGLRQITKIENLLNEYL